MKTTTQTIARISAWQAGYTMAACYLFGFLLFMPLMFLIASVGPTPGQAFAGYFGAGLLYILFGFLFTALSAWIYNVVAGFTGGFTVEIKHYDWEAYAASGYTNAKEQTETA